MDKMQERRLPNWLLEGATAVTAGKGGSIRRRRTQEAGEQHISDVMLFLYLLFCSFLTPSLPSHLRKPNLSDLGFKMQFEMIFPYLNQSERLVQLLFRNEPDYLHYMLNSTANSGTRISCI